MDAQNLFGVESEAEHNSDSEIETGKISKKTKSITEDTRFDIGGSDFSDDENDEEEGPDNDELNVKDIYSEPKKPLDLESLKKFTENVKKTGLIYISHIPPFMQILSKYGEIGRIYLAPEDPKITARRKKYKKNRRVNFTEGWVEFMDKSKAKMVANLLNAQPIGGKKRDKYHDDVWTMKYLPKFKWNNLTEQLRYEKAVKEQRLRNEMRMAKKINKEYVKNVEKAKMLENIQEKKRKRQEAEESQGERKEMRADKEEEGKPKRQFRQRQVVESKGAQTKTSILSKIFS